MKTKMTKIMSLFLAALTAMSLFIVPASAVNLPSISSSKYISTYTYKSSGKIYAYKEAALKNKTGGYIACATDECRILKISGDAVQVSYPVSGGRKTAWFSREAFTYRDLAADGAASTFTASKKITTYRWKGNYTTYGYIAKGDKCYLLRGDKNSEWLQLVYPAGSTYKMAWVLGSDLYGTSTLHSPVPSGSYFNTKTYDLDWYGYHDINVNVSTSTPVYAIADGTIVCKQAYKTIDGVEMLTSYGNYIEFTSTDKTYTAKYCHLNKFNGVPQKIPSSRTKQLSGSEKPPYTLATKSVKKGDIIGYIGETGNASGVHLHFELFANKTRIDPTSVISGLTK